MSSTRLLARCRAFVLFASLAPLGLSQTVEIVTGAGRYVDVPGTSVPVAPNSMAQLAIAPDGKLYLSDLNSRLLRYDPSTGTATALPANDDDAGFRLGYTTGLAVDRNGALHVAANGRLLLADPDAGTTTDLGPFYSADQMTFGPDGTLYFVTGDYTVHARLPSGTITTIAGTTEGFSGDGGPAVNAQLMYVRSVALGPDGNLYISDFGNHRIRRIDLTTGIIDTVVGPFNFPDPRNPTLPVTLIAPYPLAFDPSGNMVLGLGDQRIVRIDAVSGQVSLLAGSGYGNSGDGGLAINASIAFPQMMAFDASGNLYFADQGITASNFNHVRRVDAATGIITRVLGNNSAYFCGEGVPARFACFSQAYGLDVDAGQNVLISDVGNKRLRTISAGTNQVSTVPWTSNPPSTSMSPLGIEHDAAGNVYFASFSGYQINKIDAVTHALTRVAGTGNYGFSGDGGWAINATLAAPVDVAVDAAGNLYIADSGNNRVRRVDTATPRNISTFWNFSAPGTVEVDGFGNLLVAGGECRILRINLAANSISNVAGTGTCATQEPAGGTVAPFTNIGSGATFAIAPNGDFYLAWSNTLYRIETTTGILTRVPAPPGGLATADGVRWTRPAKMEFDAAGHLYLTDDQKPYVFRISGLLDTTPPIIEPVITGAAGNLGWYRSNVHVAWSISDPESAIRTTTACGESDVTFDTDGLVFTCSATSSGGTTTRSVTIRRDTVAPAIEFSVLFPPEDGGGWYRDDVEIHYTTSDERSGVYYASQPSPIIITGEGNALSSTITITDTAGNATTQDTGPFRIDRSPPSVDADVIGPRGDDPSWFVGDARIRWYVSDSLSPIIQREGCDDVVVSTDTAGTIYTCTARSGGGSASWSVTVKRDTVPPTVTFGAPSPAPNAQGWNNTAVSLPYTIYDATSGAAPLPFELPNPFVFTEDGPGQILAFLIRDIAGNLGQFESSPINIDRSPPDVQARVTGTLGNNGWYTGDVEVNWLIDEVGGVESVVGCDTSMVDTDTAGVTFGCTVVSAGGSTSRSVTIKRDATAPVVSFGTPSPLPNANGWNKTNVNIPFTRSDALSGVASASAASPLVLATEGAGLTAQITVTDNAGNSTTATSPARNIDRTVPLIEIGAPQPGATYGFYADGEANYFCEDISLTTCTGTVENGAQFNTSSAGTRTFRVNARDSVNFTASTTITYYVASRFNFDEFLPPVAPPPTLNLVARGALVPIRWQLPNSNGSFVTNPASFVSASVGSLSCGSATAIPLNDTASGPAGLGFDASTNTFTYHWQTNASWTGCRKLTIKLKDQTTHELRFRFQ